MLSMALAKSPNSLLTDFCRQTRPVIRPITSTVPTMTISADRITPCSSCRRAFSRFNIDILQIQIRGKEFRGVIPRCSWADLKRVCQPVRRLIDEVAVR